MIAKHRPSLVFTAILFFISFSIKCQDGIGIGTLTPDPASILHVQDASGTRGVLLSRVRTSSFSTMLDVKGSLVYDSMANRFAYYNDSYWTYLNSWSTNNITSGVTNTVTPYNVGIKTSAAPTAELEVNGTMKATTVEGFGTIPVGGIILWSGSSADVPAGYALCDGRTVGAYTTPNLVSSFVRGSANAGTAYSGAIDVIPFSGTVDEDAIYNLNYSFAPDQACSAFETVYSFTYDRVGCDNPAFNGPFTQTMAAASCADAQSIILIPLGCTIENITACSERANTGYYLLDPTNCLNDNILVYWDLAYIMRVE